MDIEISIETPDWDLHPEKSTTDNWNYRKCVSVMFPGCDFKWIPSTKQLDDIKRAVEDVNKLNKELAKEYFCDKHRKVDWEVEI